MRPSGKPQCSLLGAWSSIALLTQTTSVELPGIQAMLGISEATERVTAQLMQLKSCRRQGSAVRFSKCDEDERLGSCDSPATKSFLKLSVHSKQRENTLVQGTPIFHGHSPFHKHSSTFPGWGVVKTIGPGSELLS
jgi:hypothetical protein